ncbi:MAG: NAD(P)-dependent oxidoreductase [Planctomycetota bacterium]
MRVLITGHNGYIGQVLDPMLQSFGHDVVGLDTFFFEGCQFDEAPTGSRTLRKDIRDVQAADLEGFDAIVFLAALSNDALGDLDPGLTVEINHSATVRFAQLAKQAGVQRFIFSSSCSLYGAAEGDELLTEESPMNPVTAYGKAKIDVERELVKLADDHFSPTYMRNATAYGLSPSLRIDLVVNNLTGYAYTTGEVLMKSDGSPWRPLVHVEDIAAAMRAVLESPRDPIHNQAFNVGQTDENYQIRDVARIVQEVVPNSVIKFAEGAEPDKRNYRVSFDKICGEIPTYQPQWNVRQGVEELYKAYQAHGLTVDELNSSKYLRIKTILGHRNAGRLDPALRWS